MRTASPIHRSATLRQQVYDEIREQLRSGLFRPGERLKEVDLADALSVSRTPVREALGLLGREGLLAAHPRGGFAVPDLTEQDIDEVFEVRRLLEPYAAGRAARRATPGGLATLQTALTELRACLTDLEVERFADADARFRSALFAMVDNVRLVRCIEMFEDHVQYVRRLTLGAHPVRRAVISGHLVLLDAVRRCDTAAAAGAVETQLATARAALVAALDRSGGTGGR